MAKKQLPLATKTRQPELETQKQPMKRLNAGHGHQRLGWECVHSCANFI
jgi:hypothetical protein